MLGEFFVKWAPIYHKRNQKFPHNGTPYPAFLIERGIQLTLLGEATILLNCSVPAVSKGLKALDTTCGK